MKGFLVKAPEGMLELWKRAAAERRVSVSQMIREAVNKELESGKGKTRGNARS